MARKEPKSLFRKLTRLFRSGPVVKRKIRALDTSIAVADKTKSSGTLLFQKSLSPTYATITSNAYNLSERLMRYQDFQEMEYCLSYHTLIPTSNGMMTIGELAQKCDDNPEYTFIVYSYDHEKRQIVPAFGKQARQTRSDHAWKVTFDSGQSITASPEHRLMLRDGTYRKVEDLQPGDSMMPFYRKDLFAGAEAGTKGYSWIYTMDDKFNGWTKEHQLIAEWIAGRSLTDDECVHHINFNKTDNRPENLQIMTKSDHNSYHAAINNGVKWAPENHEWVEQFKKNHAEWMRQHAPTRRRDVTFGRILETCERVGFNLSKVVSTLDVNVNLIHERLVAQGFATFQQFVNAYSTGQRDSEIVEGTPGLLTRDLSLDLIKQVITENDTKKSLCVKLGCTVNVLDKFFERRLRSSWSELRQSLGFTAQVDQCHRAGGRPRGTNNNDLTFQQICDAYEDKLTLPRLAAKLLVNKNTVISRLAQHGFDKYSFFQQKYENHKVVSVEYVGVIPLYDLTVDGYKNFATDTVVSHNTPEIAAAMDIYADETVAADEKGRCLHIYSDNEKIKELLEDLFYNVLNVEFNLRSWARNLPVHKDTVIPLLDGRNVTIEQLAGEFAAGKQNWVYSVQDGTHRTVPGKVAWCGLTRKDSELVRVWLDDGTYVDCTPDHEWVLRDGTQKRADELVEGTSLMPFYRELSTKSSGDSIHGYEKVYDAETQTYKFTHRLVADELLERLQTGDKQVVHHVDLDKRNNSPDNLKRMTWDAHQKLHEKLYYEVSKYVLKQPKVVAKKQQSLRSYATSGAGQQSYVVRADKRRKTLNIAKFSEALRVKFDARCLDHVMYVVSQVGQGKYVGTGALCDALVGDELFAELISAINPWSGRNLATILNKGTISALVERTAGIPYHLEVLKRFPCVESDHRFSRARVAYEKRLAKSGNNVTTSSQGVTSEYQNHKVVKVEHLTHTSDVYCMEVLGAKGEHDRHNFMVLGRYDNGSPNLNGGICLANCKYGDFFLYNDVSPEYGVVNAFPIPVNEVEREENYDRDDPFAVRFRWVTLGNRTLENWEVTHFRLLGNDMFLPYGSSIIEPARRIWRQLILIEDAMLVYRVVRAPERRVFYVDVANIPPNEVSNYIEQQRQQMRTTPVVDRHSGRVDLRYNPMCLSLNTTIKLQDSRILRLADLIVEWNAGKQDQWVYSIDPATKQYVPGKIIWAGVTRQDAELVRVTLDDGSFLDVTPDHRFMLRNGEYQQAQQLTPGQPLMPLYTQLSSKDRGDNIEGYEQVYDPMTETWVYTHRQNVVSTQGFGPLVGKVVHHDDHNKLNNDPTNLVPMTWVDHQQHHTECVIERNQSAQGRAQFGLNRQSLEELIRLNGYDLSEFRTVYMPGNAVHSRHTYLNHTVVSVEKLPHREDTGCITVERWHNFAAGGYKLDNGLPANSMILLHNSVEEDFFIPVRGNESGTKIDTLAGGQNTAAVEDVAYIQKKLFAALKIPRAYLGYDEMLCLAGDTRIPLLSGHDAFISELAEQWEQKQGHDDIWVYSCDLATGQIVPGKVKKVWQTKEVTELYYVTLDDGTVIKCTDNHPFLCRDGAYKRADELTAGQSLMPLYRKLSSKTDGDFQNGYEKCLDNGSGEWKFTHRIVNEAGLVADHSSRAEERSYVVHHIDHDKRNNVPSNLLKMGKKAHSLYHSTGTAANLLTEMSRDTLRAVMKTEEYLTTHLVGVKGAWDNDDGSRRDQLATSNTRYKRKELDLDMLDLLAKQVNTRHEFSEKLVEMSVSWTCFRNNLTRNKIDMSEWLGVRFGGKPRGRRPKVGFSLQQLSDFCVKHNITSMSDWRRCVGTHVCGSVVTRILKDGGFKHFGQFVKTLKCNHKVVSIEVVHFSVPVPVYDLEVEQWHNFAVQGRDDQKGSVFVHNSSKATLAQEDIRFSRTISVIQKTIVAELNKLAIIHLYAHGYDNEDLQNFTLRLSNPSTVGQQQKLELWRAKFEIAGSAPEGMASKKFIRREIWGLNQEEIDDLDDERLAEKKIDDAIEAGEAGGDGGGGGGGAEDLFGGGGGGAEAGGGEGETAGGGKTAGNEETPPEENAGEEPDDETEPGTRLLTGSDDPSDNEDFALKLGDSQGDKSPIRPKSQLQRALYNNSRKRHHGASSTHMPDFKKMTSNQGRPMEDPYDNDFLSSMVSNPFAEGVEPVNDPQPIDRRPKKLSSDIWQTLRRMEASWRPPADDNDGQLLVEGRDVQSEIDAGNGDVIDADAVTEATQNDTDDVFTGDNDEEV